MKNDKNSNFLLGAAILCLSGIIVKIIGALYKIPLSNLFGKEGLGYFYVAYNIYAALYVISSSGLPAAVSKLVAEAAACGNYHEARRIFKISLLIFSLIGAAFSICLVLTARRIAVIIGNSSAYYSIVSIAPAVFFSSVISAVRGYYQGLNDMMPTAISQITEASFKLALGFLTALGMLKAGYSMELAVAGSVFGVTVGTAVSAVYLILIYISDRKKRRYYNNVKGNNMSGAGRIIKKLIKLVVPITLGASVSSIANLIDIAVVMKRMQQTGFSESAANALYGAYNMAVTVFNLPQTLIISLGITIIPAIAAEYSRADIKAASQKSASAQRITMLAAFPCAVGLSVLAEPVMKFIYFNKPGDAAAAAPMLCILGAGVVFVSAVSITNSILQAIGKVNVPVITMLAGALIKVGANYLLIGNPAINIAGAAIATVMCYAVAAALNVWYIVKYTELKLNLLKICVSPLVASAFMGAFAYVLHFYLRARMGGAGALMLAIGAAAPVYLICVRLVGGIEKDDVLLLPRGEKIAQILKM